MCELLGMSSDLPATLTLSLNRLAAHGAPPAANRDGWGVGYYEAGDVRLIKEAEPANDSDWIRFIENHDLTSTIAVAHIRKATAGALVYRNTHPFTRELAGRRHLFAHNGSLPGIFTDGRFRSLSFMPVGETDSELAFCALLERMRPLWAMPAAPPRLRDRLSAVADFAAELRALGPANFLYSDGDALFAHGHRRIQARSGRIEPPGLVCLQRNCGPAVRGFSGAGVSLDSGEQSVTLFASVPLTDEPWQPLAEGEVIAVSGGRMVGAGAP